MEPVLLDRDGGEDRAAFFQGNRRYQGCTQCAIFHLEMLLRRLQGDFFQVLATSFGLEIPIKDLLGCTVLAFQGTLQIQSRLDLVYQKQRLNVDHCRWQKFLFVDIAVRLSLINGAISRKSELIAARNCSKLIVFNPTRNNSVLFFHRKV